MPTLWTATQENMENNEMKQLVLSMLSAALLAAAGTAQAGEAGWSRLVTTLWSAP